MIKIILLAGLILFAYATVTCRNALSAASTLDINSVSSDRCDELQLCETNCLYEHALTCFSNGPRKFKWFKRINTPFTIKLDMASYQDLYQTVCVRHASNKLALQYIMDTTRDSLLMIDEKTPSQTAILELIENQEFTNFWLNFKALCDKNIKGKNRIQRGLSRFKTNKWRNETISSNLKQVVSEDAKFFANLNEWAIGKYTPSCQCQQVKTLLTTGIAPDNTKHPELKEKFAHVLGLFTRAGASECRKAFTCVPQNSNRKTKSRARRQAFKKRIHARRSARKSARRNRRRGKRSINRRSIIKRRSKRGIKRSVKRSVKRGVKRVARKAPARVSRRQVRRQVRAQRRLVKLPLRR